MDIKQVATELLEVLKQGLVSGSKIIAEQFPILCQQILKWGIWVNILWLIISIVIMVITFHLTMFAIKKQGKYANSDNWGTRYDASLWLFISVPSIIVGIIFFVYFWSCLFDIGKIILAPNLYLLDYFKGLVTPSK